MSTRFFWLVALGLFSCGEVRKEGAAAPGAPDPSNPEAALEMGGVLRMSWLSAGGKPMEGQLRDRHCRSPEEFQSLQYGEALWVACKPGEVFYGGVLTRLDPNKKEAQSFWQFPQILPLDKVVGFAPLSGEQLAVLYRVGGVQEKRIYALGITKADGWALPPMELSLPGQPLGFAWNGAAIDLVVGPRGPEIARPPTPRVKAVSVLSFMADGKHTERSVEIKCEGEGLLDCALVGAYLRVGESRWRVLVIEHGSDRKISEHKEDGSVEGSQLMGRAFDPVDDLSVSGLLNTSQMMERRLLADGKVVPHPDAPRGVEYELYNAHANRYRVEDGRLSTYCLWAMVGSRATLQSVNGRLLYTDLIKKTGMLAIVDATNPSQPKEKQVGPIAGKLFRWRCTDLSEGSFVAKKDGGYWLIGENGCYVELPGVW